MYTKSAMSSNHLILCHPLLLLPSIFPSIRVFSNKSALLIRWPKCWSFSFSISPSKEYSELTSVRIDWLDPCSPRYSQESSPTPYFFSLFFFKILLIFSYFWLHWVFVVAFRLSCSMGCGIFLYQGLNLCPRHCNADS